MIIHVDNPWFSRQPIRRTNRRSPALLVALIAPIAFAGMVVSAPAQDADKGRFVLQQTESGIIRLDTLTGEVSKCGEINGEIACRLAADERRSVNARFADLEDRIAALEARVSKQAGPDAAKPDAPKAGDLPSDEELDHVFNMMERFMHRFVDVFKDLDRKTEDRDRSPEMSPDVFEVPVPEKT